MEPDASVRGRRRRSRTSPPGTSGWSRGGYKRRGRIGAILVVLGAMAVSAGCAEDDAPVDRDETVAGDRRDGAPANLLAELRGWELTFLAVRKGGQPHLYVANADGSNVRQLDRLPGDKQTPNWSPDGRRVALRWVPSDYDDPTPLLVLNANGTTALDLTQKTGLAGWSPSWSPDGKRLVTAARRKGEATEGLYVMNADGTAVRRITPAGREAQYAAWSPAGDRIAFTYFEAGGFDLFTIRPDGSGLRRLTRDGAGGENNWAMWSPDGNKIAWGRGESVWVMNADGSGKRMVTDAGGVPGAWGPGPFITFQCETEEGVGICAVRDDGKSLTTLLGGMEAGFPGWRPRRTS
jgi:Tol biopolymer transport system component